MKMLAAIAFLALLTGVAGAAPAAGEGDEEKIERAREALKKRLLDAETKGVVAIKGSRAAAPPAADEAGESADEVARPALTPAARQAARPPAVVTSCLTADMIADLAAATAADPMGSIQSLQNLLLDNEAEYRGEIELQLATAYLAIGFAEEAGAIARGRTDARAVGVAALAALMQGGADPDHGALAAHLSCGPLYGVAMKALRAADGVPPTLTSEEAALMQSLPPAIASPIAGALALSMLDHGERDHARALRPLIADAAVAAIVDASLTQASDSAIAALAPVAADPGPMQARAIEALAASAASHPDANALVDENLADAAASAPGGRDRSRLNELLAGRLAMAGKIEESLRALGRSAGADKASPAATTAAALLGDALKGPADDKRLQALSALANEPDFASHVLGEDAAGRAIEDFMALGAARELQAFLDARGVTGTARDHALARALLRAGDADGAATLVGPHASRPEFQDLAFKIAAARDDAAAFDAMLHEAERRGDLDLVARIAWRRGDFERAATARSAIEESGDGAAAERLALALLAARRAAPSAALPSQKKGAMAGLRHMFSPPPANSGDGALRAFAEGVATEIAYIRKRRAHE